MRTEVRGLAAPALALGDAAAILLFAVIGLTNHREGITVAGLARNAVPILVAWFLVVPLVGTYSRPGLRTLLATWSLAVPGGVATRALVLRRDADTSQLTFLAVTLLVTLILLVAWRGIARVVVRVR